MAIGLTAKQKADLAAMLPNIDDSVSTLKRLIADTKDRSRALQKLADAEEAQKRHAVEVGIPFNADAFARRRHELEALPKTLTVEDGQLAAFSALQRAVGIVLEGPFERAGRGGAANKPVPSKTAAARSAKPAHKGVTKKAAGKVTGRPGQKLAQAKNKTASRPTPKRAPSVPAKATAAVARVPFQKPLPLALGS